MSRLMKIIKLLQHIIFIIILNYLLTKDSKQNKTKNELIRFIPDLKHILLWNTVKGFDKEGQRVFIDRKCEKYNCYITKNRSLFTDIRYFDALLFNLQDLSAGYMPLPEVRGRYQKYIFAANDSSDNYPICNQIYDNYFNWTWTYRIDSILHYRYFNVYNLYTDRNEYLRVKLNQKIILNENNIWKETSMKSKAVCIFLDKCITKSRRELFIADLQKELKKYNLTVDIYGKCGNKECRKRSMKPCFTKLKRHYFFYLALEDSLSTDYVTDSVLYAYNNNAVPIVYGKVDYDKFLPPSSYINALHLEVSKLAETIFKTTKDLNRYHKYFEWKHFYTIKEQEILDPCELCAILNDPIWLTREIVHRNFINWWNEQPC